MKNRNGMIALLGAMLLFATTGAPALAGEMIVTGISGVPRANNVSLLMHDRLSERPEAIELETNRTSSVSVLYGGAIALQLGPSTMVRVHPATDQRGELIELVRGELRSVTKRDRTKKRPEIHTPSAVIRPSTTTLHLFVDHVSGDTVATSLESRAWIVSSDSSHKQSAILNSGQQVTIKVGNAPGTIRKYLPDASGDITGFWSGRKLRDAALTHDMNRESQLALNRIASNDIPIATLAAVASPFPTPASLGWRAGMGYRDHTCRNTVECQEIPPFPNPAPAGPPPCNGIPGEQCTP
ncbi:MAG: FecR domain-containing protein [Deltaproteobacteria bacterium]|nr:FecR domain-containing protein [Deltaproteobacteria bacterium]